MRSLAIAVALLLGYFPNDTSAQTDLECGHAPLVFVHPEIDAGHSQALQLLEDGAKQLLDVPTASCSLSAFSGLTWDSKATSIIAIGRDAAALARTRAPAARQVPIMVSDLPAGSSAAVSLYINPDAYVEQLVELSPGSRVLWFIYLPDVPDAFLAKVQSAVSAHGLQLHPVLVSNLREAALAVNTLRGSATKDAAAWFHRGVLQLDVDVLLPPLVRASWDIGIPVFSDDAAVVERGLLFALTPDYVGVGKTAAQLVQSSRKGLVYPAEGKRVLNRRTARAIGLSLRSAVERRFDYIYE